MTPAEREIAILDRLRAKLTAEGYEVILQPSWMDLPEFLQDARPDAVAHRGNDHLVVEIASRSPATERRIKELREALHGQEGWQLQTVWTSRQSIPRSLDVAPLEAVNASLREIDELIESKHLRSAFLLCWAILEGLGRTLLPQDLAKPQTPRRLIEYLAANGFIDRKEAQHFRRLADVRNRLIHGELHSQLAEGELIEIRDVLRKLHDTAVSPQLSG